MAEDTRQCTDCNEVKPLSEFPVVNQVYRRRRCVECHKAHRQGYSDRNREKIRTKARQYYADNTDQVKASVSRAAKKYRRSLKLEAIEVYGGRCQCCGEDELAFMTLDHVENNGAEHRRELKELGVKGSAAFYKWLKNNQWPKGYQVLCFNCNVGRHINGGVCPHQETGEVMP